MDEWFTVVKVNMSHTGLLYLTTKAETN